MKAVISVEPIDGQGLSWTLWRFMRRMAIATVEIRTAFARANTAPDCSVPVAPGLVMKSTPRNPTISADQRWTPTFSLRITIDSKVVKSGAGKADSDDPGQRHQLESQKDAHHRAELGQRPLDMIAPALRAAGRRARFAAG